MGSDVHIVTIGAATWAGEQARTAVAQLEQRWSRFLPTSEISRLNAAGGAPVHVSDVTVTLVELAVEGWRSTGGRFDPTVLDALVSAGYDASFDRLPRDDDRPAGPARPAPGCDGVEVDRTTGRVRLPPGVHLDPGGIGKGLAADLVATLLSIGGGGALVNIGGDIRVAGTPPNGAWRIDLDLAGPGPRPRLALHDGAVVTSSTLRRAWRRAGGAQHHLIDPATGVPGRGWAASASVVADTAWRAEVWSKAVVLADGVDAATALLRGQALAGLAVDGAGSHHLLGDVEDYLA